MEKKCFYFVVALLCTLTITSCVKGGSYREGSALGVLEYDSYKNKYIMNSTIGPAISEDIDAFLSNKSMVVGGCYKFDYRRDDDLKENYPDNIQTNGYCVISIKEYTSIPLFYIKSTLTDTTEILDEEIAVLVPSDGFPYYVNKHLFLTQVTAANVTSELRWDLSYDYITMAPSVDSDGKRYYDLYIRATRVNDGETIASNRQFFNAYYIDTYLENSAKIEKELLGSKFDPNISTITLRFNYVSEIDNSNSKITWKSSTVNAVISTLIEVEEYY